MPFLLRSHSAQITGLLSAIKASGRASPHAHLRPSPMRRAAVTSRLYAAIGSRFGSRFRTSCNLRIERFEGQNTGRTLTVQFGKIPDQPYSLPFGVSNRLAANFPEGRRVSCFQVLLNGNPIFRKQGRLTRIANRDFAQSVATGYDKNTQETVVGSGGPAPI